MFRKISVVIFLFAALAFPGCAGLMGPSKAQIHAEIQAAVEAARIKQEGLYRCTSWYTESENQAGNKRWNKSRSCKGAKDIIGEPTILESRDMIVTPQ